MEITSSKPKHLSNIRGSRLVTMVSVLEGKGIEGMPYSEQQYIIDDDGKIIGRVDREWFSTDKLFNLPPTKLADVNE